MPFHHRRRTLLTAGGVLAAAALVTAASLTDSAEVLVMLDGNDNTFDIQTAGSAAAGWSPAGSDWVQGNPDAFEIAVGDKGESAALAPGASMEVTVAVKNASPKLSGFIGAAIYDPNPLGDQVDPATGRYLELFDQLRFTVSTETETIADTLTADEFNAKDFAWPEEFTAGGAQTLKVVISLPREVDNRWMGAGTSVQFAFTGENS
jgi:hypothetical protein